MTTKYLTQSDEDIKIGAELLRNGGTVIFPTETVYGLGANALDSSAADKIFAAKGRPSDNPLIVHIAKEEDLTDLVNDVPHSAKLLADKFWPGPLTLIFKKSDKIPYAVTGGLDTVAVRMPKQKTALRLIELAGVPVAAPSANISGKPSPTAFEHVKADMDGRVDAVIDGGACEVGVESTVLDVSGDIPILYRPGRITAEEIEEVIGRVELCTQAKANEAPKSPGLKYKHYAPNAEVQILHGSFEQVERYAKKQTAQRKTGMLVFDEFPKISDDIITYSLGRNKNAEDAAHYLFDGLRSLDLQGAEVILAPEIPQSGIWRAVRNRLYRAAGENIVDLTSVLPKSILMVCTGNTCRSPMAEGVLKKTAEGMDIKVSSAGLAASAGAPPSTNAVLAAAEKGVDISAHRARQLTADLTESFDLIVTMTASHKQMILAAMPDIKDKVVTLGEWSGAGGDVRDPFGGDLDCYRRCLEQIDMLVSKAWEKYR